MFAGLFDPVQSISNRIREGGQGEDRFTGPHEWDRTSVGVVLEFWQTTRPLTPISQV